jgi:hypothetical protein
LGGNIFVVSFVELIGFEIERGVCRRKRMGIEYSIGVGKLEEEVDVYIIYAYYELTLKLLL